MTEQPFVCDAAIRLMLGAAEIRCERTQQKGHMFHRGALRDYAYPGSVTTIEWAETDRRNFHGDWPGPCVPAEGACVLPSGHEGDHAP